MIRRAVIMILGSPHCLCVSLSTIPYPVSLLRSFSQIFILEQTVNYNLLYYKGDVVLISCFRFEESRLLDYNTESPVHALCIKQLLAAQSSEPFLRKLPGTCAALR